MNRMRRGLCLAIVSVVGFSCFGASGRVDPLPAHAASQNSLVTIRVGFLPIADFIGLYTAVERGYFRSQGLDVVLTPLATGPLILSAMQGGSLDIGVSSALQSILATSHGLQPVLVTHGLFETRANPTHAIIVMKNSSIHVARDLEGKRVAVNGLQTIEQISMEQWLQDHGGSAAQTHFVQINFANMVAALAHGQVDAALASEPGLTIALGQGARIIGHQYADERSQTLLGDLAALRPWAASHGDVLRRFAAGYTQGVLWANGHSVMARTRYLTKYTHLPPALATKIKLPTAYGKITPDDLNFWMRLAIRWHVLSHSIDVKQLIWPTASR
jgi:NitT/TauT family transport system substrate-binding protein